jgi:hypothetical protein
MHVKLELFIVSHLKEFYQEVIRQEIISQEVISQEVISHESIVQYKYCELFRSSGLDRGSTSWQYGRGPKSDSGIKIEFITLLYFMFRKTSYLLATLYFRQHIIHQI